MNVKSSKILVALVLLTIGIFLFAFTVQKYQLGYRSRAELSLPMCEIPEGESQPTNTPCGTCTIDDPSISSEGTISMPFVCQILCNNSGDANTIDGCEADTFPRTVTSATWAWCRHSGVQPCTSSSDDFIRKGEFSGGPWILENQQVQEFLGTATQPTDTTMCGRLHITVQMNVENARIIDLGTVSCDENNQPLAETDITPTVTEAAALANQTNAISTTPTTIPTETITPTVTATPIPPTPTPTQVEKLAVNDQPPGVTPWLMIFAPIGIILLGIFL